MNTEPVQQAVQQLHQGAQEPAGICNTASLGTRRKASVVVCFYDTGMLRSCTVDLSCQLYQPSMTSHCHSASTHASHSFEIEAKLSVQCWQYAAIHLAIHCTVQPCALQLCALTFDPLNWNWHTSDFCSGKRSHLFNFFHTFFVFALAAHTRENRLLEPRSKQFSNNCQHPFHSHRRNLHYIWKLLPPITSKRHDVQPWNFACRPLHMHMQTRPTHGLGEISLRCRTFQKISLFLKVCRHIS